MSSEVMSTSLDIDNKRVSFIDTHIPFLLLTISSSPVNIYHAHRTSASSKRSYNGVI